MKGFTQVSYNDYIKKVAVYTRRICTASTPDEVAFFSTEMEKFMNRNKEVADRAEQIHAFRRWQRSNLPGHIGASVRHSCQAHGVKGCTSCFRRKSSKPFITAKDFVFLRDLKVKLV